MKKHFGIVLFAAAILAGCQGGNNASSEASTPNTESVVSISGGQIAYVNIDSLASRYDMYLDLRTSYEAKAVKAESNLTSKGRKLEKDIMDYQDKVQKGLITRSQAATMEQTLNQQQQDFITLRDQTLQELAEEEQVLLNQIQHSIVDFLKVYNKDGKYAMIISTSASGPVLNADPSLNITQDVQAELNKSYKPAK